MDSLKKLKETKLPPREAFYSRFNDEGISDEDYVHARKVWETFEMKNLEDYHNLYNEADVLLLADVFENFRDICIENYNLDPGSRFSLGFCIKSYKSRIRVVDRYRYVVNGGKWN